MHGDGRPDRLVTNEMDVRMVAGGYVEAAEAGGDESAASQTPPGGAPARAKAHRLAAEAAQARSR